MIYDPKLDPYPPHILSFRLSQRRDNVLLSVGRLVDRVESKIPTLLTPDLSLSPNGFRYVGPPPLTPRGEDSRLFIGNSLWTQGPRRDPGPSSRSHPNHHLPSLPHFPSVLLTGVRPSSTPPPKVRVLRVLLVSLQSLEVGSPTQRSRVSTGGGGILPDIFREGSMQVSSRPPSLSSRPPGVSLSPRLLGGHVRHLQ